MITDINYYKKVGKRLLVFILTILAIYILFKLSIYYVPFLIAFIISLLIEPLIRKVMKYTNLTRKVSAIITLIVVFGIIIGLLIWGITVAITESTNILTGLNNNVANISNKVSELINGFKIDSLNIPKEIKEIANSSANELIELGKNIAQNLLTYIINIVKHLPQIAICVGITILATYFVCADRMYILDQMEHHLPRNWTIKIGKKIRKVTSSLGNYLKAEAILILISFIIVLIGLFIFKIIGMNVKYPLIMALIIGFVDALPILGSGTVMVPWAVILAFNGDIKLAVSILIVYAVTIIGKQLIEPKVVSNHIGIHPIFTLIAMYTGFKLIGIIGMFVGPIALIIFKNVFETMIDNGVVKTILDRR